MCPPDTCPPVMSARICIGVNTPGITTVRVAHPAAIDDAIAEDPDVRLEMDLAPGDVQLVSNHTVIHARTAFVDADDPEEQRHLLRLWLSLPNIYRGRERLSALGERVRLAASMAGAWVDRRRRRTR